MQGGVGPPRDSGAPPQGSRSWSPSIRATPRGPEGAGRGQGLRLGAGRGRGAAGSLGVPAGGHSGGRGAMEAPAELLAALPVLATALALLLAWLLVRRGATASPEPVPPAKAPETPAAPGPCAPEPAAAPESPGELEGPGEREAAPAVAEEQAAEARQVRTRPPPRTPLPHPGARLPLSPRERRANSPPPPPSVGERPACRSCVVCSGVPLPGPRSLLPRLGSHPPLAPHPSGPGLPGSTCMWLISRSAIMRVVSITKK